MANNQGSEATARELLGRIFRNAPILDTGARGAAVSFAERKLGDVLVATAREVSRSGRSGIYDVRVSAGDVVIAEFRGHSRSVAGTWLPVADDGAK